MEAKIKTLSFKRQCHRYSSSILSSITLLFLVLLFPTQYERMKNSPSACDNVDVKTFTHVFFSWRTPTISFALAWYDTTSRKEDMFNMKLPPLGKEHVPRKGVHIMHKIDRGDTLRISQFNHIRALQHPDRKVQQNLFLEMGLNSPVIGHISPVFGPTAGGTLVHVWGTNFAGGDIYKCRFGSKGVVMANYNNASGTISCTTPPFKSVAAKNLEVPFTVVIFTTNTHSHRPTHVATHSRKFTYYTPEQQRPILLHDPVPGSGPTSGGTKVTVTGKELYLSRKQVYNCRFGDSVVPAKFQHAQASLDLTAGETVTCITPSVKHAGWVKFELLIGEAPQHVSDHRAVPHSDNVQRNFFYYNVSDEELSMKPWAGPYYGAETMLRISVDVSSMEHHGSTTISSQDTTNSPLQCRFGGQVVTPAIYDFQLKVLKCIVPKEELMPFSPSNEFSDSENDSDFANRNVGNSHDLMHSAATIYAEMSEKEQINPRGPRPDKRDTHCNPLMKDCHDELESVLSEAVKSAERDMRPIEDSRVSTPKLHSDPSCRADASILLSDLERRLRTRIPFHRRSFETYAITASNECDIVMWNAEQEISAALLSLNRLCDEGKDLGSNVAMCGEVMYAGKKNLLMCQAISRIRDAACHHWPKAGCYSDSQMGELSRYICKTTTSYENSCGSKCPELERLKQTCPKHLTLSVMKRGLRHDPESLTIQWGVQHLLARKDDWARVGVAYTLCVWRRQVEESDSIKQSTPELISKQPLSAAMVENTIMGDDMNHSTELMLKQVATSDRNLIIVRIERSIADNFTKPGARCQWSRTTKRDVCASASIVVDPAKFGSLETVQVSMELVPRLSKTWHRESERPSDVFPPPPRITYQWATGIHWQGKYAYLKHRSTKFDTICVYALYNVIGSYSSTSSKIPPKLVDGFFIRDFRDGYMPLPNSPKYKPYTQYVARYEHRDAEFGEAGGTLPCAWHRSKRADRPWASPYASSKDIWGEYLFTIPVFEDVETRLFGSSVKCDMEMRGRPPVTVLVEVSLNGQQFTPLSQFYTYYDPNYFPSPAKGQSGDMRVQCPYQTSLSFHPSIGSANGGTIVTVYGLNIANANIAFNLPFTSRNDASIATEIDVWPRSALHGSSTNISIQGVPMKRGLLYYCRFGRVLVAAKLTSFVNGALSCVAPSNDSALMNKTVGFSILAVHDEDKHPSSPLQQFYTPESVMNQTATLKYANTLSISPGDLKGNVPLRDIVKKTVPFSFYAAPRGTHEHEDDQSEEYQNMQSQIVCLFGSKIVAAIIDRGNLHLDSISEPKAPSVKCISPKMDEGRVAFAVKVGETIFSDFTYQDASYTAVSSILTRSESLDNPDTQLGSAEITSVYPPTGYCGSRVLLKMPKISAIAKDLGIFHIKFGRFKKLLCLPDASVHKRGLRCPTGLPQLPSGRNAVQVSVDGQQFENVADGVIYYDAPCSFYITPNRINSRINDGENSLTMKMALIFYAHAPVAGPMSGGTLVTITGRDFSGGSNYKCKFGGTVVPGNFNFDSGALAEVKWHKLEPHEAPPRGVGDGSGGGGRHGTITCVAPPTTAPGTVRFSISVDGMTWCGCNEAIPIIQRPDNPIDSPFCNGFTYYPDPEPEDFRVVPLSGPINGGTELKISGHALENLVHASSSSIEPEILVKFVTEGTASHHSSTMRALFDSRANLLKCLTPPGSLNRKVVVQISINHQHYHTVGNELFSYVPEGLISNEGIGISPNSGTMNGGTIVKIHGVTNYLNGLNEKESALSNNLNTLLLEKSLIQSTLKITRGEQKAAHALLAQHRYNVSKAKESLTKAQQMLEAALDATAKYDADFPVGRQLDVDSAKKKVAYHHNQIRKTSKQLNSAASNVGNHLSRLKEIDSKLTVTHRSLAYARSRAEPGKSILEGGNIFCKFGKSGLEPARNSNDTEYGDLICESPPFDGPQVVPMDLVVRPNIPLERLLNGTNRSEEFHVSIGVFTVFEGIRPMKMYPLGGSEIGGNFVSIMGSSFSNEGAYEVHFGNVKVAGLFNAENDALVVRVPPLRPGPHIVRITQNGHEFVVCPAPYFSMYATRVHVMREVMEAGVEVVSLHYAPPRDRILENLNLIEVVSVKALIIENRAAASSEFKGNSDIKREDGTTDGLDKAIKIFERTANYGRFAWHTKHKFEINQETSPDGVQKPRELFISKVLVTAVKRNEKRNSLETYTIIDDNNGLGWSWRSVQHQFSNGSTIIPNLQKNTAWLESLPSAIRGGAIWNDLHTVNVKMWPESDVAQNHSTIAMYNASCGCVQWQLKGNDDLPDGSIIVATTLNGIDYTHEHTTFVADKRLSLEKPIEFVFRLSDDALSKANMSLPFNIVGRKLFDERVIFDLSETLGVSRNRFVVTELHKTTGVVKVHCIASEWTADPTCIDIKVAFKSLIDTYGSIIYDGVIFWAVDPLFPSGRIKFIDGVPHITGECSDPTRLTREQCLESGQCHGSGGCDLLTDYDNCVQSMDRLGVPCRWKSENHFNDNGKLRPLNYASCSDPSLKTESECLNQGNCSDPTLKTREKCLAAGHCDMPPGYEHRNATNKDDCENPNIDSIAPRGANGICNPPSSDAPSGVDYSQFKNRHDCLNPSNVHGIVFVKTSSGKYSVIVNPHVDGLKTAIVKANSKGASLSTEKLTCTKRHSQTGKFTTMYLTSVADYRTLHDYGVSIGDTIIVGQSLCFRRQSKYICGNRMCDEVSPLEEVGLDDDFYSQWLSNETCEDPLQRMFDNPCRTAKSRTAKSLPKDGENGICGLDPNINYEGNSIAEGRYNCEQWDTKQKCEEPQTRIFGVADINSMAELKRDWGGIQPSYPDLSVPTGHLGEDIKLGPKCLWLPYGSHVGDKRPFEGPMAPPSFKTSGEDFTGADCQQVGPPGIWDPKEPTPCGTPCTKSSDCESVCKGHNNKLFGKCCSSCINGVCRRNDPPCGSPCSRSDDCSDATLGGCNMCTNGICTTSMCGAACSTKVDCSDETCTTCSTEGVCIAGPNPSAPPAGLWQPGSSAGSGLVSPPKGRWIPDHKWKSPERWLPGVTKMKVCPCKWTERKYHLTKCNWMTCGPGCKSVTSGVSTFTRVKQPKEMTTDYQALGSVGGKKLWLTYDTMVSTSWVMTALCFLPGCFATPLFMGFWIPMFPMAMFVIDLFDRGLVMEGGLQGMVGHSLVQVGGQTILGAPLAIGLIDMASMVIGEQSFNHSGSIGFGFWEDNLPMFLPVKDPALDILKFQMCGNIFFPIPGAPIPLMKPFELWGFPWYFPTGLVFKFSFFFGDTGGCLFMDGGFGSSGDEAGAMAKSGLRWIMVMPVAVKLLLPSWLFILSDVKVRGHSIHPCVFGICKASVHSGQFSTSGPRTPMLKLLIETTAAKDCTHLELLPDVAFTIMGKTFTMNREEYVIYGNNFGNKECLTAFTPSADLIEAFSMWIFGDMWIRVFYTVFDQVPLRRIGFAKADQRYYEKNGCSCGQGRGPIDTMEPQEVDLANAAAEYAENDNIRLTTLNHKTMSAKRYQNWQADIKAIEAKKNQAEVRASGPAGPCMSGMRFKRTGACIPNKMIPEIKKLREFHDSNTVDDKSENYRDGSSSARNEKGFAQSFFNPDDAHITNEIDAHIRAPEASIDDENTEDTNFIEITSFTDSYSTSSTAQLGTSSTLGPYRKHSILYREEDTSGNQAGGDTTMCPIPNDRAQHHNFYVNFETESEGQNAPKSFSDTLRRKGRRRNLEAWRNRQISLLDIGTHAGMQIHLSTDEVESEERMAELFYNMTLIFKSWRPILNVSSKMVKNYWRGEHEEYVHHARNAAANDWHELLEKARRRIKASSVMSMLNKRVLKRVLEKNWPEDNTDTSSERDPEKVLRMEEDIYDGNRVNEKDDWGVMAGEFDSSIIGGRLIDRKPETSTSNGQKQAQGFDASSDARHKEKIKDETSKGNAPRFKAEAEKFFGKLAGWASKALKDDPEFWHQLGSNGKAGSDPTAPWKQLLKLRRVKTKYTRDEKDTDPVNSMVDNKVKDNIEGYDKKWLESYLKDTTEGNAERVIVPPKQLGPESTSNPGKQLSSTGGIGFDRSNRLSNHINNVGSDKGGGHTDGDGMSPGADGTRFAAIATEINDDDPKLIAQTTGRSMSRIADVWQQEVEDSPSINIGGDEEILKPTREIKSRHDSHQYSKSQNDKFSAYAIYADMEKKHREHIKTAKLKLIELEEQIAEVKSQKLLMRRVNANIISHEVRDSTSFFDPITGRVLLPGETPLKAKKPKKESGMFKEHEKKTFEKNSQRDRKRGHDNTAEAGSELLHGQ